MPSSVQGGAAVRGGGPPRDGSTKWVTAWATKWVRSSVRRAAVVAAVQGGLQGAGRLFLGVVGGHAGSVLVHDGSLRSLSWCVWAAGEPWFARSGTDIGLTARQSLRSGCRPADDQAPLRQRRITTKRRMTTREITPRQQGCPALWPGFSSSETRENVTFTTGEPRPNTGARPCSERERSENLIAKRPPGEPKRRSHRTAHSPRGVNARPPHRHNSINRLRNHAPAPTPAIASEGRFEPART